MTKDHSASKGKAHALSVYKGGNQGSSWRNMEAMTCKLLQTYNSQGFIRLFQKKRQEFTQANGAARG
jgi:hypothetical protein